MSLLDKIIELRANSVTPEEFKETWGITKEEHRRAMSDFIDEQYAKAMAREEKAEAKAAVIRAAAAAKAGMMSRKVKVKRGSLMTGSGKSYPVSERVVIFGMGDRKAASSSNMIKVYTPDGAKIKKGGKGATSLAALKGAKLKLIDVAGGTAMVVPESTTGLVGERPLAMVKRGKMKKRMKGRKGGPKGRK